MAGHYYNQDGSNSQRKNKKPNTINTILIAIIIVLSGILVSAIIFLGTLNQSAPNPNSPGNQSSSETTSTPTTAPTDPIDRQEVAELMKKAEFIAAGYDYTKAIGMLESYEYFDDIPELAMKVAEYRELDSKLVTYARPDTVTHIFFHSLIVDPSRAFDRDEDTNGYNMYMATISEFVAIMEQMYEKGYVLISPYDLAYEVTDDQGTRFVYGKIRLPAGKKPFIMSQDDVNYYSYMIGTGNGKNKIPIFADTRGDGFAHKIVIGDDGYPTCLYMDKQGNVTSGDYDLVPVLEKFIQEHPDFSYHGARAVLGVTGYEGVFGYRTKPSYAENMTEEEYAVEVQAAKEVVQCLKDHGWIIASHSYGHPPYGERSAKAVEEDSDKWENTVQPIVGETDIILYPHGSDIHTWRPYTTSNEKFNVLYEDGYRYFFNVDSSTYWNQLGPNYFRGGRRNIDGIRMYHNPDKLADLFDVESVFDPTRPTPVPK